MRSSLLRADDCYPDALPGGLPFETYTIGQAEEAVSMAGEIVSSARSYLE